MVRQVMAGVMRWMGGVRGLREIGASAAVVVLGAGLLAPGARADDDGRTPPAYQVAGHHVTFCSCEHVCGAVLGEEDAKEPCAFVTGLHIEVGHARGVALDGMRVAIVGATALPGQRGRVPAALYVPAEATVQQVEALHAIVADHFAERAGPELVAARSAVLEVDPSREALVVRIDGVCDLKGRALPGRYGRPIMLQQAPRAIAHTQLVARGHSGRVLDRRARVAFGCEGRSVLYGRFDLKPVQP